MKCFPVGSFEKVIKEWACTHEINYFQIQHWTCFDWLQNVELYFAMPLI